MGVIWQEFKILVNFSHFWPFGTPLLGPKGHHSPLSFSTTLSALDECNNNLNFLPEWNGWWQTPKNSWFWSILAIFGPFGPLRSPLGSPYPSFWKFTIFSSKISSKWDQSQVIGSIHLGAIRKKGELSNNGGPPFFLGKGGWRLWAELVVWT